MFNFISYRLYSVTLSVSHNCYFVVTWQSSAGRENVSTSSCYDMSSKKLLLLLPAMSLVLLLPLSAMEKRSTAELKLRTLMMFRTHPFPVNWKVKTQNCRAIPIFITPLIPWILVRTQVPSCPHILSQNKTLTLEVLCLPACVAAIHYSSK